MKERINRMITMGRAKHTAIAMFVVLSAFAGCSEPTDTSVAAGETDAVEQSADEVPASTELGTDEVDPATDVPAGDSVQASEDAPGDLPELEEAQGPAEKDRAGLRPFEFPYPIEVPGSAAVTDGCVTRGEAITLEVETKPEAALGYQAIYHGNESGAPEPFGKGHGGNNKGQATIQGTWADSWVVGPKAPLGKARVDVVIGWEGKWGYEKAYFTVAASNGDCP